MHDPSVKSAITDNALSCGVEGTFALLGHGHKAINGRDKFEERVTLHRVRRLLTKRLDQQRTKKLQAFVIILDSGGRAGKSREEEVFA